MNSPKPITIVGGGIAGLTLGIGLRQRGIPTTVWEAGNYPRHRVCGEFISGRGQDVLTRLGLTERLIRAGAVPTRTAKFVLAGSKSPARPLPRPAVGLSRFVLDDLLANLFLEMGGVLRIGKRWRESERGEGLVWAGGRRRQAKTDDWRWVGLKIHARRIELQADLEMHVLPEGYVGLTRLKDGEVNICGLFRRATNSPIAPSSWRQTLRGPPGTGLHECLSRADFDHASFASVAALSLQSRLPAPENECCIGDALTMTPPVTGNGMSMAFEAAELALNPLVGYSRAEVSWTTACQTSARACNAAFTRRLVWAQWLQRMMLSPAFQSRFGALALRSGWFWRLMFGQTR